MKFRSKSKEKSHVTLWYTPSLLMCHLVTLCRPFPSPFVTCWPCGPLPKAVRCHTVAPCSVTYYLNGLFLLLLVIWQHFDPLSRVSRIIWMSSFLNFFKQSFLRTWIARFLLKAFFVHHLGKSPDIRRRRFKQTNNELSLSRTQKNVFCSKEK